MFLILCGVGYSAEIKDMDSFDVIIVNSANWVDVYSGMLYSKLVGKSFYFLTSDVQAVTLANVLNNDAKHLVLEGDRVVYSGMFSYMKSRNLDVEQISNKDFNTYFADHISLENATIVDATKPQDVLVAASYALQRDSWVFVVDDESLNDVKNRLSDNNYKSVLQYGHLPQSYDSELSEFITAVIDEGDHYSDNVKLLKDYNLVSDEYKQITVSSGSFLEYSFFSEKFPLLILGNSNSPQIVEDYLKESNVQTVVVVGNEVYNLAYNIRNRLKNSYGKDINFILKAAQSSRTVQGELEGLDLFPLPVYVLDIAISNIQYNKLSHKLEVLFENKGDILTYFKPSVSLELQDETLSFGGTEVYSLGDGKGRTVLFDVGENTLPEDEDISGSIFALFGETPISFPFSVTQKFDKLNFVTLLDDSEIEITKVLYSPSKGAFFITVKNVGSSKVYIDLELVDVIVDGVPTTLASKDTLTLEVDGEKEVIIRSKLTDLDIIENEEVLVTALYGMRRLALVKQKSVNLPLEIASSYMIVTVVIIFAVVLLLLLFLLRKKEYTCKICGTQHRTRSKPKKCKTCSSNMK